MNDETLKKLESLFLAMSDRTRLRLLALMAGGEVSVGFLADELGESQPKISRHLAYLRGNGLVSTRRDGKRIFYGLENQPDAAVALVLDATLSTLSAQNTVVRRIPTRPIEQDGRATGSASHTSDETHISAWSPNEIEIFLL